MKSKRKRKRLLLRRNMGRKSDLVIFGFVLMLLLSVKDQKNAPICPLKGGQIDRTNLNKIRGEGGDAYRVTTVRSTSDDVNVYSMTNGRVKLIHGGIGSIRIQMNDSCEMAYSFMESISVGYDSLINVGDILGKVRGSETKVVHLQYFKNGEGLRADRFCKCATLSTDKHDD